MKTDRMSPDVFVAQQILASDVDVAHAMGVRSILCVRPDDEDPDQSPFGEIRASATARDLEARHLPVAPAGPRPDDFPAFVDTVREMPHPMLAYCRSGALALHRIAGSAL